MLTKNTVNRLEASVAAYDGHPGPRAAIRYEYLVADTVGTLTGMLNELGTGYDRKRIAKSVQKLAFENVPEKMRGPGNASGRRGRALGGRTSRRSRSRSSRTSASAC